MKTFKITRIIALIMVASHGNVIAQQHAIFSNVVEGYELNLKNITFDSTTGDIQRISLRRYGLEMFNYSVLVNAKVEGYAQFDHLPGRMSNGDSFAFKLKMGNRLHGDTLLIIRRSGEEPVTLSKVKIMAFRGKNNSGIIPRHPEFRTFLLARYRATKATFRDYYSIND